MKSYRIAAFLPSTFACVAVAAAVLLAAPAPAPGGAPDSPKEPAEAADAKPPTTAPVKPTTGPARPKFVLKYRPVVTETSSRREVGLARGARGAEEKEPPRVYLIAPEASTGTTTREQPMLYWYISEPTERKVELSLIPMGGRRMNDPVLRVDLDGVRAGGIQALDLSKARGADGAPVKLETGKQYRWAVAVVLSKTEKAKNPTAQCTLKRVAATDALAAAAAYAEAGVWCDALAALQQAIEADPNDASLRAARREFLASQKLVEDEKGNISDVAPQR